MKKTCLYYFAYLLMFSFFTNTTLFSQSNWSDPATWGGTKPAAGDEVIISASMHVILDEDPPELGSLTIQGTLEAAPRDLQLHTKWILVQGLLRIGSENAPYTHQATITLNGDDPSELIMGVAATRGIMVMGGQLELHGNPTAIPWTKINAHAPQGSTSLTLSQATDWQVGDEIVVAPTDYYEAGLQQNSVTQKVSIDQLNGSQLIIDEGLNAFRWGLLQYATNAGMSLSPNNLVTPPAATGSTPTVLDERAAVAHLSRNIVIQAPDDAAWNNDGFGAHVMIMRIDGDGAPGIAHVEGVEFRRAGQKGRLGRYPFHWHMLSYHAGTTLADAQGQYVRNSTVNVSQNRGLVIHGTNGVELSNNVIYNVKGHGVFLEDASERRNIIDGNLVLHVRNPDNGFALKVHESTTSSSKGSSGFWLSNPDNTVINNLAADCTKTGFWLAYPSQTFGLSTGVGLIPVWMPFGVFDNNTAHSNGREGIRRDDGEINDAGAIGESRYVATTVSNGADPNADQSIRTRFTMSRYKVWKNGKQGIWDRSDWVDNYEIVSADNQGRYFAGAGFDGYIERSLVVGTSLNYQMNGTGRFTIADNIFAPAAFATYHSTFRIQDNIAIDFPAEADTRSGVFATDDYYTMPVEKGQIYNTNNLLINSHPGVKVVATAPYFVLAGALWDPEGVWGGTPGDYLVYDAPFFTYGQTPTPVAPSTAISGGVLASGPFYGVSSFVLDPAISRFDDLMAINVVRLNTAFDTVGIWTVAEAVAGQPLDHMRHFAAHADGYYGLDFPTADSVDHVAFTLTNMHTTEDALVLAIEFSSAMNVRQAFSSTIYNYLSDSYIDQPASNSKHIYTPVADRQALLDATGEVYWEDDANGLLWVKIQAGLSGSWANAGPPRNRDDLLYRSFNFRVVGEPAPFLCDLNLNTTFTDAVNDVDNGTAQVVVNGGTPPYSYAWSNGATTAGLANLSPGVYAVTVTDANGCTAGISQTIASETVLNYRYFLLTVRAGISETYAPNLAEMRLVENAVAHPSGTAWTVTSDHNNPAYAFDDAVSTRWGLLSNLPATLMLDLGAGNEILPDELLLTPEWTQRAFASFKLEGSDDAENWTLLLDVDSLSASDWIRDVARGFPLPPTYSLAVATADGSVAISPAQARYLPGSQVQLTAIPDSNFYFEHWAGDAAHTDNPLHLTMDTSKFITAHFSPCAVQAHPQSTDESQFGANDGEIILTVSQARPPYTYLWNTGANTDTLTQLAPGTYTAEVTDAVGCSTATVVTIQPGPVPQYRYVRVAVTETNDDQRLRILDFSIKRENNTYSFTDGIWDNYPDSLPAVKIIDLGSDDPIDAVEEAIIYTVWSTVRAPRAFLIEGSENIDGPWTALCEYSDLESSTYTSNAVKVLSCGLQNTALHGSLIQTTYHSSAPQITLAPNPAQGYTLVTVQTASDEDTQLFLMDLTGRIRRRETLRAHASPYRLDTGNLLPGVYWVAARTSEGEIRRVRLVVQ